MADKRKGIRYYLGRLKALLSGAVTTIMNCFPKTGEWFLKHVSSDIKKLKNRSRNICNPSDELLGVANHVNYIGLSCLKIMCPEYASYKNNEEL